jgi:hypothetical protein
MNKNKVVLQDDKLISNTTILFYHDSRFIVDWDVDQREMYLESIDQKQRQYTLRHGLNNWGLLGQRVWHVASHILHHDPERISFYHFFSKREKYAIKRDVESSAVEIRD